MTACRVEPGAAATGVLEPPPSKSDAQRLLVLAHALDWPEAARTVLTGGVDVPGDVAVLARGLGALEPSRAVPSDVDCRDGGAPFRFLVTQAAVTPGAQVTFSGTARLGARPHGALLAALERTLGPAGLVLHRGAPWPLRVRGATGKAAPEFHVDASSSSQHASSLLLGAAALAHREGRAWTVQLEGRLASPGYLDLTVAWARRCGLQVVADGGRFVVRDGPRPARVPDVPGDWSSLGYLLLLAWASGAPVRGVHPDAPHPDRAVLGVLAQVGLAVDLAAAGGARVSGAPKAGFQLSVADCPDLAPTLAALACVVPGPSELRDVAVLRLKESDRVAGVQALVEAAGGKAELDGDRLRLWPPPFPPAKLALDSKGDHRLAMAAATLAVLLRRPLELGRPEVVEKSFPAFWRQVEATGATVVPS